MRAVTLDRRSIVVLGVGGGCVGARSGAPARPVAPTIVGQAPAGPAGEPTRGLSGLNGRYYLALRVAGVRQPDMIDFKPGGRCTVELAGRTGLPGVWEEV